MRLIKPSSGLRVVSTVAILCFATLQARDLNIPDPSKLALLNNVAPGDVVVLKNGTWKDARLFVKKEARTRSLSSSAQRLREA